MSGVLMLGGLLLVVVAAWLLSPVAGLAASGCWCVWVARKLESRKP
jgi:uncharacterized protein involved in cysteine biosynthesis